jgi:hypothetical protein
MLRKIGTLVCGSVINDNGRCIVALQLLMSISKTSIFIFKTYRWHANKLMEYNNKIISFGAGMPEKEI